MRLMLVLAFAVVAGPAAAEAQKDDVVSIGPWQVEAKYRGAAFDSCVMSRVTDDEVEVTFMRDVDGLSLAMSSKRWKLDKGETYPVELVAGSSALEVKVSAGANSVSGIINDDRFLKSLKLADTLAVKGAGATIQVPLERSADALQRLETCHAKNGSATDKNPFVAPPRSP